MQTQIAIFAGKAILFLTRFLNIGGGSAAPGLYALKIDPNLVEKLAREIPKNIVITGTNGKTTTSRMIAHFAKENDLKVIRNHTGSNLERGIASTLITSASFSSKLSNTGCWLRSNIGIWELDEAAFNSVAPKINPQVIVFLNIFRDQLDRYGEIDTIIKKWAETLKSLSKETTIILNADDANILKLKTYFKGKIITFGVKDYKIKGESIEQKKEKENFDFEAKNVKLSGLKGSTFELMIHNSKFTIQLPLPGLYHIYDTLAAISAMESLAADTPTHRYTETLKHFSPAFGRVEKLDFGYIFLIKNPAGATQVFQTIAPQIKSNDRLLLALNDNLADGTDVSWIWDAEFERLQALGNRPQVIASGTRAYDLAVRLKYAGFSPKNIQVIPDLQNALKQAKKGLKGSLFILPTYTAMLELQKILTKSGVKKHYWEES